MTTKKEIRHTFTQHWCHPGGPVGHNAWLIKGDFDRFKLTNDLYGSLICDYLLDWTLDVIETELTNFQKYFGCDDLLWNFMGDDVTVYIPPSTLTEQDIARLFHRIRESIRKSYLRRYVVGTLPMPSGYFDDIPSDALETMRSEFESMDIVFDFAGRHTGYLVLVPVGADGRYQSSIQRLLQVIQHRCRKPIPHVDLQLNWIHNPADGRSHTFNSGFLEAPSVSFAGCSIHMGGGDSSASADRRSIYEQVSMVCQSALKTCKLEKQGVLLQRYAPTTPDVHAASQPVGGWNIRTPLRWSSERYVRETLYFKTLKNPVLFQFNPVYHSNARQFQFVMDDETLRIEKYRGNKYGVGLKGINEIFGQITADCLITELMSVVSKVMLGALTEKGIAPAGVHIARFVDRFTVCCERPVFQLSDIVEFVSRVAVLFNAMSDGIRVSHLRTNVVFGDRYSVGYRIFKQLTLTSLSPRSDIIENLNPPIEVRQNQPVSFLQDGSLVLERNSYLSANLLGSQGRADSTMGQQHPKNGFVYISHDSAANDPQYKKEHPRASRLRDIVLSFFDTLYSSYAQPDAASQQDKAKK